MGFLSGILKEGFVEKYGLCCPQQVGTDGQKNFLVFNLRCKGNNKSSIGM